MINLKTKSGHSLIAVKRAMQKYARRGMATKMLEAVSEIDTFRTNDYFDNLALQRDMINQLKTLLFEEVSFSQPGAFILVAMKITEWEESGRKDRKALADIASTIAYAKKLRMPSYLRSNYGEEDECNFDKEHFLKFVKEKDISSVEWVYHNEEEALEMLDDCDFPGKHFVLPMCKAEWKRLKRTESSKRFMFIVVPWLWVIFADDLWAHEEDGADTPEFTKKEVVTAYKKRNVKFEDFVMQNEKRGEEVVYNEDNVWLAPYQFLKEWHEECCGSTNNDLPPSYEEAIKMSRLN